VPAVYMLLAADRSKKGAAGIASLLPPHAAPAE